ncbi:uncharacterized protein SOCEGT47_011820 [Sorangium cellulosum]|uniref:PIN domain-containing protein n=1 Tax=Sorangium cellulosum TaxID=56 RepID=A0A4P2PVI9_SORCE|nr:hypothetical protein [Sorangium cellulosum]AUX20709.1 uncharacterized protein SOCEGT47_011820 [Sorangium cellulosum]
MPTSVEELIGAGGAVLAFDTNALSGHRRLFALCDVVNQLREPPAELDLRLCAPVIAHEEMMLHLRHEQARSGRSYDPGIVRAGLEDKRIEVVSFDLEDAEGVAELLASQFPTPEAWRKAKRQRCVDCLHLSQEQADGAPGRRCSATVDWLIAGQVVKEGWILVTGDKGPEFREVPRKIELGALEALLGRMLARRREGSDTSS